VSLDPDDKSVPEPKDSSLLATHRYTIPPERLKRDEAKDPVAAVPYLSDRDGDRVPGVRKVAPESPESIVAQIHSIQTNERAGGDELEDQLGNERTSRNFPSRKREITNLRR
jgi:hypothetical protein